MARGMVRTEMWTENPGSSTLTRWRWYLRQGKPVDSDTHTRRPWTPTKVTWARTVSIVRAVWEHSGCMGDRTARSACGNRRTSVGVVGSRGVFFGGGKQPRLRGHQRRHTSVTYFTIRPWVGKLAVEEDHRSTKLTRCRGTRRVETTHANSQQKRGRLGTRTYDWTYSRIENGVTSTLSDCVTRFCPASSTG